MVTTLIINSRTTGLYTIVIRGFIIYPNPEIITFPCLKSPPLLVPGIYNPSPANGATISNINGAFTWSAVSGATGYDLYLGEGVTQPLQKIGDNLASPSLAFPALTRGKIYYWQVVAHTAREISRGLMLGSW